MASPILRYDALEDYTGPNPGEYPKLEVMNIGDPSLVCIKTEPNNGFPLCPSCQDSVTDCIY